MAGPVHVALANDEKALFFMTALIIKSEAQSVNFLVGTHHGHPHWPIVLLVDEGLDVVAGLNGVEVQIDYAFRFVMNRDGVVSHLVEVAYEQLHEVSVVLCQGLVLQSIVLENLPVRQLPNENL